MVVVRASTDISSLRLEDIDSLDIVALGSDIHAQPPEDVVPDVLLIDVTFSNNRSIDAIRDARDEYPDVAILAHTPVPDAYELIVAAIEAGAHGFVVVSALIRLLKRVARFLTVGSTHITVIEEVSCPGS